ncbi:MAG: transcriptional regulator [Candidatus Thermoplasmatota archaeon]|nr:transcriptional regulator [Candidatus Thermoplasmatota archaeon]
MPFEMYVTDHTPMTGISDIDAVAITFLHQIGYFPKGYDPKTNTESIKQSVPYKLFMNCFMKNPEKAWKIDELITILSTSRPTVYRHLNKLKSLDLLEEVEAENGNRRVKCYRIRYGNLSKAWNFVEAHVKLSMENYRKTAEHLQSLIDKNRKGI